MVWRDFKPPYIPRDIWPQYIEHVTFERFTWRLQSGADNQNRQIHDLVTTHTGNSVSCSSNYLNADKQFLLVNLTYGVCFLRLRTKSFDNTVKNVKASNGRVPMIIRIVPVENHQHKSHYEGIINIRHNRESVSSMHLRSHNKKNSTGMRYYEDNFLD